MQPTIILKRRIPGLSERGLSTFVCEACRAAGLRGTVSVLVTSSREMRTLNARFRGKPQSTDVLSFPSPTFAEGFAGDIAVSLDMATQNARRMRHTISEEVRILVLHGILHLAGYDHEDDNGEMEDRENQLRRRLGIPEGLIERVASKRVRNEVARSRT
jgi:probable rRNA maturation factor